MIGQGGACTMRTRRIAWFKIVRSPAFAFNRSLGEQLFKKYLCPLYSTSSIPEIAVEAMRAAVSVFWKKSKNIQ